jgi:DNA (cytosine-5)-methyltransferase 1
VNVLAFCAGVGGLELGLRRAVPDARTVCYVEGEAFAAACLVKHMEAGTLDPAPIWSDVRTFDPDPWVGLVDCITGGYPCQPFSVAGQRRGTEDPRHLWPYIAQHVAVIRPEWCFFENVRGHLSLGFDVVARDLCALGYRVEAGVFTASEVGAPHERARLFIMAHADRAELRNQPRGGAWAARER